MKYISPEDGHKLSEAISFLVNNYSKTGHNSKPVVFHSLNVAFYLLNNGYSLDLVKTAVLHDLIEDSETTKKDISSAFGDKIADWVDALSFKTSIENKELRYKEMFNRIKESGRESLIVKCADIYSNSFYIKLVDDVTKQYFLVDKLDYFLEFSKDDIGKEIVWSDLCNRSKEERKRLKNI